MNTKNAAIRRCRQQLKAYLDAENEQNGTYEEWYDSLADFRRYMRRRYVRHRFGKSLYAPRIIEGRCGDLLDHHTLSYLAPLHFTRTGWDNGELTAAGQLRKVADWMRSGGGRFIHLCLPNKGVIYPQLICDDPSLLKGKSSPAPQWRKHVRDIADAGIEVIDIYPVFKAWADGHGKGDMLFAKEHNISALGAKLIADTAADYLRKTTDGIQAQMGMHRQRIIFTQTTKNGRHSFLSYLNTIEDGGENRAYITAGSDITIFGDCNLQSHSPYGAGITANLAYNLQYPIRDAGRVLIFDGGREADNRMSLETLKQIRDHSSIMIYCAFASAAFTRTAVVTYREMLLHPRFRPHKWAHITLK